MGEFRLVCRAEVGLSTYQDLEDYVIEDAGEIRYHGDEDEGPEPSPLKVGEFKVQRVLGSLAQEAGEDIFEVCDAASQELHEACYTLFSLKTRQPRQWLQNAYWAFASDFLLIESITLDPKWRGLRVGLLVLRRLIDLFAPSEGMVVCQPFAFGAESEEQWREGTVKLRRYVRGLGFRRLKRSRFYGLSTANVIPTAGEVLRGGR